MHASTLNSSEVIFGKYDLSQSSRSALAKADVESDIAEPETRLWKLGVVSQVGLTIETTLRVLLGLIAAGAGAHFAVEMFNFVSSDAMTHAVRALLR